MKRCSKCKEPKEFTEFSKCKSLKDGLQGICKSCKTRYSSVYNKKNKDKIALSRKKYRDTVKGQETSRICRVNYMKTETGKAKKKAREKIYKANYPLKAIAQRIVYYAIKSGEIKRGACEVCKSTHKIEAHHKDYSKPLEVNWLCNKDHNEWHKHNEAIYPVD